LSLPAAISRRIGSSEAMNLEPARRDLAPDLAFGKPKEVCDLLWSEEACVIIAETLRTCHGDCLPSAWDYRRVECDRYAPGQPGGRAGGRAHRAVSQSTPFDSSV
jgi:hypothetical protein